MGVYCAASPIEQRRCNAEDVIVVGGGNSAGQAATYLAQSCRHVHIMVRGRDLASSMSRYLIRRIEETPNITLHRCTEIVGLKGDTHLERVRCRDNTTKEVTTRAIRHVFSMIGAKPNSQWLDGCVVMDDKCFVKTGSDLTAAELAVIQRVNPTTPDAVSWSIDRRTCSRRADRASLRSATCGRPA